MRPLPGGDAEARRRGLRLSRRRTSPSSSSRRTRAKTAPAVPKFLKEEKVPFVCWQVKTADPQTFIDAADRSWDGTLPYTIVYDRKGAVAARLAGPQSEAAFAGAIRTALGAPR